MTILKTILKTIGAYFFGIFIFICKLTILPSIMIDILMALTRDIIYIKISDYFVLNKKRNSIEQAINKDALIKIWTHDYYKHRDQLLNELKNITLNDLLSQNVGLEQKNMKCNTNLIVYKEILEVQIGKKNIQVEKDSEIKVIQAAEKLLLLNPIIIWKHLIINIFQIIKNMGRKNKKDFIHFILREETVKTYKF